MIIDDAIKVNKDNKKMFEDDGFPILAEATQLGIEALKRIKAYRKECLSGISELLPGETEE